MPSMAVTEPLAVASGLRMQLEIGYSFLSPAKAGSESKGAEIPGLRSLRSHKHPTRDARAGTPLPGLNSVAATRLGERYY